MQTWRMSKARAVLLTILVSLLQSACTTSKLADFKTAEDAENTIGTLDELPLRSGQIIVSEAGSSMSFLMNLIASEYAEYGHAGVLIREPDGFYVYEAFGFLNLQLWKPPTQRLHGKIRRVPLLEFLGRGTAAAIYQHTDVDLDAVASYARASFDNKLAFDGLFDLRTSDSVYCSEFVARALEAGGHEPLRVTRRTTNPSLLKTMSWLELDAPSYLLAGHLIDDANKIARFSKRYTPSQLRAHFSFEKELHSRFDTSQRLGNVFQWTSSGPRYRKHLAELRNRLIQEAVSVDEKDVERWSIEQIARFIKTHPASKNVSLSQTN